MIRRDAELTAKAEFLDHRSYISNWIHPGTAHRCVYVFGKDSGIQRLKIYDRSAGFCEGCPTKHWIGWDDGEWHHKQGGRGRQHCDCVENGMWVCPTFHRQEHVQVKWRQHAKTS